MEHWLWYDWLTLVFFCVVSYFFGATRPKGERKEKDEERN